MSPPTDPIRSEGYPLTDLHQIYHNSTCYLLQLFGPALFHMGDAEMATGVRGNNGPDLHHGASRTSRRAGRSGRLTSSRKSLTKAPSLRSAAASMKCSCGNGPCVCVNLVLLHRHNCAVIHINENCTGLAQIARLGPTV